MKTLNLIKKSLQIMLIVAPLAVFAQNEGGDTTQPAPKPKPIRGTFENAVVINNQTVENTNKKTLEFMIQHRFGVIKDGTDLWGLFAPANIRLGVKYSPTNNLAIGIGVTKDNFLEDLDWKYVILRQMKGGGMPVTIAYYGDATRSAKPDDNFYNLDHKYVGYNRLSYFNELMIARKFNRHFSLQAAFSYSYFNIVDSVMQAHAYMGVSAVARYSVTPQGSIIADFDFPITKASGPNPQKPNLGIGYEISTGGHQFQFFLTTASQIVDQQIRVYNQNDFTKGQLMLGFNITRQWGF